MNMSAPVPDESPELMTPESLYEAGLEQHKIGALSAAEELYAQALLLEPEYLPALHMSSTLAFQRGDNRTALKGLQHVISLGHQTAMAWWHYGCVLVAVGDANEAVKAFSAALLQKPDDADLLFNLGTAARQAGHIDVSLMALKKASVALNTSTAYYEYGLNLHQSGKLSDALVAYDQALSLQPNHTGAALNAGVLWQKLGDLPKATDFYRRALAANPDDAVTQVNLGVALQEQGLLDEAVDLLLTVLAKDPAHVEALNNLGVIQQRMGDDVAAAETYHLVLEHAPFHAQAIENLATILSKTGFADPNLIYPRMLVEKMPEDTKAWVLFAKALKQNDAIEEAAAAIQNALKIAPHNAEALFILASIHKSKRDMAASLIAIQAAAVLEPDNIDYLVELGLTTLQSGNATGAIKAFDAVLAIDKFEQRALAYRPVALRLIGDIAADSYTDPHEVAIIIKLPAPSGYADMESYLSVLADDLRAISLRTWTPRGQSVRGGTQTELELFMEKAESIQALRRVLDQIIPEYFNIRRQDTDHPFYGCVPSRITYRSWSIVTRKGGYHVPHIHPEGCLSGVFYVALPALTGDEGCLELGRPGINNMAVQPVEAPKRLIRPEPGNLVLFPSYLWHGTLPYEDDGERITIAFDIVRTL